LPKIGCHGNVPKGIKKRDLDRLNSRKYLSFGKKIAKIGPVDLEIIWLQLKKEINASKIYSSVGNLAERAKQLRQPVEQRAILATLRLCFVYAYRITKLHARCIPILGIRIWIPKSNIPMTVINRAGNIFGILVG